MSLENDQKRSWHPVKALTRFIVWPKRYRLAGKLSFFANDTPLPPSKSLQLYDWLFTLMFRSKKSRLGPRMSRISIDSKTSSGPCDFMLVSKLRENKTDQQSAAAALAIKTKQIRLENATFAVQNNKIDFSNAFSWRCELKPFSQFSQLTSATLFVWPFATKIYRNPR